MIDLGGDEAKNPTKVPVGTLRAITESRGGHTYVSVLGRPSEWMNQFAPHGRRVRRIIERSDHGNHRTLYERP